MPSFLLALAVAAAVQAVGATEPVPRPDNPRPAYPEAARAAYVTGDVWFRAWVLADGTVQNVEIVRVPEQGLGFEDAVAEAVRRWRFEPARRAGEPVAAWFEGNVRFSLRPEDEDAIYDAAERIRLAWSRAEARILAGLFADGAHLHTVFAPPAVGPAAVRERLAALFGGSLAGTSLAVGVDRIRFLGEDRAQVGATFRLEGTRSTIGRITTLWRREDGAWLVEHLPPPDEPPFAYETEPELVEQPPPPAYPPEARERGVQGDVVLAILVLVDGTTEVLETLRGLPHGCTEAAVANARRWRWKPALLDGRPAERKGVITVSFSLRREDAAGRERGPGGDGVRGAR